MNLKKRSKTGPGVGRRTARRQPAHQPRVMLLIVPSRAFDRGLLRGVARYARLHGPWTFLREPPHYRDIAWKQKVSDRLRSGAVDAVIMREPERIEEITQMGIPAICAPITRRTVDGLVNIITDNESVGVLGAEHLLGRRFIHYAFCGFSDIYWSRARQDAFCSRIEQASHTCHVYKQSDSARTQRLWENELPLLVSWLRSLPKPVGVMACNDDRAQHVLEACHEAGLHIPGEVSLLGVDNDEFICHLANPTLSSISLNPATVGYQAAEVLEKILAGRKPESTTIVAEPSYLATRKSTDIMLVGDDRIRRALQFIKAQYQKPIQAPDVAAAANMSIRSLHKCFKQEVGCSVLEHISSQRVERIRWLLIETDMAIAQIANNMSFSGTKQLDRVFGRVEGATPTEFRRRFRLK